MKKHLFILVITLTLLSACGSNVTWPESSPQEASPSAIAILPTEAPATVAGSSSADEVEGLPYARPARR